MMLTKEQAEQYERAAVALENGEDISASAYASCTENWQRTALWALGLASCASNKNIQERAARLLRECVARNEEMK